MIDDLYSKIKDNFKDKLSDMFCAKVESKQLDEGLKEYYSTLLEDEE